MLGAALQRSKGASPAHIKSTILFLRRMAVGNRRTAVLVALCSVLLAILSFRVGGRRRNRKRLPPGPRGWPIVGMLPYLDKDNPAQSIWEMSKQYGVVFSGRLGSHQAVFLNDYDSIKEAFTRKDDAFNDRPRIAMFELYTKGHGIATCYYDNHWKEQRRFCVRAMRNFGVGKSDGRMEKIISYETAQMIKAFSQKGVAFQVKPYLEMASCNVISSMTFGQRFSYTERTFQQFLHALDEIFHFADVAGVTNYLDFMKYVPFSGYGAFDARVRELEAGLFTKERDGHKATFVPTETRDLIDAFLHEIRKKREEGVEADKTGFSDQHLLHFIADMFAAGTDTTSNSMQWVLLLAAKYEKEQLRVQEELDHVVGRDRMPALADMKSLPYTVAFLSETMRFGVGGPFAVPHAAVRDTVFRDFLIPKGTVMVPNIMAVLMDPEMFPDPGAFRPSRFLDEAGNVKTHLTDRVNSQFGIGRRICIGEHLAKCERYIFLTHILHTFTLSGTSGPDSLSLKSRGGLTRNPAPFELIMTERRPSPATAKKAHGL
ncbi:cytochrome P450 2J4-like [Diadema antillarum]|uniref:cytochrome P450 2J4-like n=1 Tax=Diadema antillarum TaxID=105358 RepID=UPI003A8A3883